MSDTPITDHAQERIHNATCLPDCDNYGHNERCPYASPEVQMAEVSRDLERMCEELATAAESFRNDQRNYMFLNNLGDPTRQHYDRWITELLVKWHAMKEMK